ncbi:MAG: hypothetical protein R3E79_56785 [Caldilineaceae bacterium]
MSEGNMEQRNDQMSQPEATGAGMGSERTPIEQMAETARATATQAAESFRRGEFLNNATNDPGANADDRLIALLAYVTQIVIPLIMPVIVLLSESSKQRPFQRYHAVQSLALTCLFIALSVLVGIGTAMLQIIPLVGLLVGLIVLCLTPIAYFMYVIALLYYGYQAYQGKRFAIPGLTAFLRDQGWL